MTFPPEAKCNPPFYHPATHGICPAHMTPAALMVSSITKAKQFLWHVAVRFLSCLVLIYFQFSFTFHFRHIFVAFSDTSARWLVFKQTKLVTHVCHKRRISANLLSCITKTPKQCQKQCIFREY